MTRTLRLRLPSLPSPPTAVAAGVSGLVWAGIIAARLFIGGTVGLGDNGDSRRLLCQLGVRELHPYNANVSAHLYPVWVAHHWYGEACGADGSGEAYHSSQLWLLSIAKHLTALLGFDGTLDLRVLGVIAAVLVGVAIGLLVVVLPGSTRRRVAVASLVGLVAADSAVADYFVSPYSEPAAILGMVFVCVGLLWLWQRGRTTWPRLAVVAGLGAFTMAAKTQAVGLLPALVVAVVWLPHGEPAALDGVEAAVARRPAIVGRALEAGSRRGPGLLTAAALIAVAAVSLSTAPQRFNQIDVYDEVFSEILPHSPSPQSDLRALGVDPALASASGSNVLSPNSAAASPAYLQMRDHVSDATIARFYLTHPLRLFPAASDGLRAVAAWRPTYMGTYTAGSGHAAGAMENRIGFYGRLFKGDAPGTLVLVWVATLTCGWFAARDRRMSQRERAVGRLAVFLALASFGEFWAVMLGEGQSDVIKQMVLTDEWLALCVPALATCVWTRVRMLRWALMGGPVPATGVAPWVEGRPLIPSYAGASQSYALTGGNRDV